MKARNFSLSQVLGPRINQVGFHTCPPNHEFGGLRDYLLLHLVARGRGEFVNQTGRWQIKQGQGFLIFPGDRHRYRADHDDPWEYRWIGYDLGSWDPFGPLGLGPKNPVLNFETPAALALGEVIDQVLDTPSPLDPSGVLVLQERGWSFLRILSDGLVNSPTPGSSGSHNLGSSPTHHAQTMQSFMNRHFSSPIGVREVLDSVHLERSYGSRVFRGYSGQSIGSYLLKLRMDVAAQFLREGLRAKETGYSVGYKDYEVFLRAFKKYWGKTTTKFRSPGETP